MTLPSLTHFCSLYTVLCTLHSGFWNLLLSVPYITCTFYSPYPVILCTMYCLHSVPSGLCTLYSPDSVFSRLPMLNMAAPLLDTATASHLFDAGAARRSAPQADVHWRGLKRTGNKLHAAARVELGHEHGRRQLACRQRVAGQDVPEDDLRRSAGVRAIRSGRGKWRSGKGMRRQDWERSGAEEWNEDEEEGEGKKRQQPKPSGAEDQNEEGE